jgi:hypothetical protein
MLVNKRRKLIISTPFKNYSTTLENIFSEMGWDKFYGAHPIITGDSTECRSFEHKHNNLVSDHFKDEGYEVILPVRNPYNRVNSMWKHSKYFHEINFDEWFFENSKCACCFPVTRLYQYDHLVKVENLVEDFESLDIKIDFLPQFNKSIETGVEFTEIQKEQIYYLHYEDFKNGEYEK